jgi:hypothetical protein
MIFLVILSTVAPRPKNLIQHRDVSLSLNMTILPVILSVAKNLIQHRDVSLSLNMTKKTQDNNNNI